MKKYFVAPISCFLHFYLLFRVFGFFSRSIFVYTPEYSFLVSVTAISLCFLFTSCFLQGQSQPVIPFFIFPLDSGVVRCSYHELSFAVQQYRGTCTCFVFVPPSACTWYYYSSTAVSSTIPPFNTYIFLCLVPSSPTKEHHFVCTFFHVFYRPLRESCASILAAADGCCYNR